MKIKIKNKIKVGDQTEIIEEITLVKLWKKEIIPILFTIIPRKKKWLLS